VIRARRAGPVLALALAAACLAPAGAAASAVSGEQLRALAAQAVADPHALTRLRAVDRVDGREYDVAGALRGARGAALRARLRTLAGQTVQPGQPAQPAPAAPGDTRDQARDVLSERRFHQSDVPGPFRSLLRRLGRALPSLRGIPKWLDGVLPGGRGVVWVTLSALVVGLAVLVARLTLVRRVRTATVAAAAAAPPRDDARALERGADAAEAAGDLELALRLRFRAGLLRLDARGAIEFRPSVSTGEVRRRLRSRDFDALAFTFDEVVYGGRPAAADDVATARERWPEVVAAAHDREVAA
jgi:hypothetical protein